MIRNNYIVLEENGGLRLEQNDHLILTVHDLKYLLDYMLGVEMEFRSKSAKLSNVWQHHIKEINPRIKEIILKLQAKATQIYKEELELTHPYFLHYRRGAKADTHVDKKELAYVTVIVPLLLSKDMKGGESYIENHNGDQKVIPVAVGDSLYYNYKTQHGVKELIHGSRRVFITWFKRK